MKIKFLSKFDKDIDKIKDPSTRKKLLQLIQEIETIKNLADIPHLKKMKGYKNCYRIRMGEYRIGVYFIDQTLEFARIASRKEIYRIFPDS